MSLCGTDAPLSSAVAEKTMEAMSSMKTKTGSSSDSGSSESSSSDSEASDTGESFTTVHIYALLHKRL